MTTRCAPRPSNEINSILDLFMPRDNFSIVRAVIDFLMVVNENIGIIRPAIYASIIYFIVIVLDPVMGWALTRADVTRLVNAFRSPGASSVHDLEQARGWSVAILATGFYGVVRLLEGGILFYSLSRLDISAFLTYYWRIAIFEIIVRAGFLLFILWRYCQAVGCCQKKRGRRVPIIPHEPDHSKNDSRLQL